MGGADPGVLGPKPREAEARAPARLVDEGRLLEGAEDALHVVLHGEDEAGRELLEVPSRVHEGRGVGHELEASHHLVEGLGRLFYLFFGGVVVALGLGHVLRHPAEHLLGPLDGLALFVLHQVAPEEDGQGVLGEGQVGQMAYAVAGQLWRVRCAAPTGALRT